MSAELETRIEVLEEEISKQKELIDNLTEENTVLKDKLSSVDAPKSATPLTDITVTVNKTKYRAKVPKFKTMSGKFIDLTDKNTDLKAVQKEYPSLFIEA